MITSENLILYYYSISPSWKAMQQEMESTYKPTEDFIATSVTDKWIKLGLAGASIYGKAENNGFPIWFSKWLTDNVLKDKTSFPQILVGEFYEGKIKFPTEELARLQCVFLDETALHPSLEKAQINHMWYDTNTKILAYNYFVNKQKIDGKLLLEFCDAKTVGAVFCNTFITFTGAPEIAEVVDYKSLSYSDSVYKKNYLAVPGVAGCECNRLIKTHKWDLCDSVMDIKKIYFGEE